MASDAQSEPAAEAPKKGAAASSSALPQGKWVVERPESGLARGEYAWPNWGIAALGGLLLVTGLVYLIVKLKRYLKR